MTTKRFLMMFLRLSFVAAVLTGCGEAYKVHEKSQVESEKYYSVQFIMDCAINLPKEYLSENRNQFGTINIAPRCAFDRETFFVRETELAEHRIGRYMPAFEPSVPFREFLQVAPYSMLAAAFFVNLLGLMLVVVHRVFRWVIS